MIVDVHTHVIPKRIVDMARSGSTGRLGFSWKEGGLLHELGYWYPVPPEFFDTKREPPTWSVGVSIDQPPTLLG